MAVNNLSLRGTFTSYTAPPQRSVQVLFYACLLRCSYADLSSALTKLI